MNNELMDELAGIVLLCNECNSTRLSKYEGKMAENGHDWFHCRECGANRPLHKMGYKEEIVR